MRLLHGDCLNAMRSLPDASVDAVIADPPYGTTACKWDAVIPFAPMWAELRRVAKPSAAIVMFAAQPFTSALVMSNPDEFRYCWVWEKPNPTGFLDANRKPMRAHEDLPVFYRQQPTYNPQKWQGAITHGRTVGRDRKGGIYGAYYDTPADTSGMKFPRSVVAFSKHSSTERLHPTQKPVDLLAYLVRTYTNPGETVLDFCMGSGTTGVACAREGRDFIGIERERAYFDIAERRIAAAQPPLFAEVAD